MSRYEGAWSGPAMRANRLGIHQDTLRVRVENGWLRRGSLNREIPESEEGVWKLLTNDFEFSEEVALKMMEDLGFGGEGEKEVQ